MGRKLIKRSLKKQSFFKVLVGDFSQHLRIPPAFIKNFNGRVHCKCALTGPSGTWWAVELEKRENGLFFHDHGWRGFVKDHVLEVGDLLVFSYDGESKFDVTIYDRSACEKDVEVAKRKSVSSLSLVKKGNEARVKDEIVDSETENYNDSCKNQTTINADTRSRNYIISGKRPATDCLEETSTGPIVFKSENSCFIVNFKKRHFQYRILIPKKLGIAEGIMKKRTLMVQDPAGRSWNVHLDDVKRPHSLVMTLGWSKCCKMNQISHGDSVIFEFVKQGVMQIHIFKGAVGCNRHPVVLAAPDATNES